MIIMRASEIMNVLQNAKLPASLYERNIGEMATHEEGWCLPWAMYAESDGSLWLNGLKTVWADPQGSMCIHICREREGFVVDVSHTDYKWPRETTYLDGNNPLPVIEIKGA
jgi:hypothetical protein